MYLRKVFERVRGEVEALAGPIADDALRDSIRLYDEHRAMMRRLYAARRAQPGCLTGAQVGAVVTSSFLMGKAEHLALLTALVEALEGGEASAEETKPKVFVVGSVCQDSGFIAAIEAAGCIVVDDDLCMGARSFTFSDSGDADPLDALVNIYMTRPACPAFHRPGFDPGKHILEQVKQAGADGVVFLLTKFCDPWGFEFVPMNHALEEAGVPTVTLEVEQNLPVPAQLRTRTEAFVELLQARCEA